MIATAEVLSWLVVDPMEEVAMDRVSIEFRVTWRLPLAIIRVGCVKSGTWGGRPARAMGGFRRKNNSATIKADERNRLCWQIKDFCFIYVLGEVQDLRRKQSLYLDFDKIPFGRPWRGGAVMTRAHPFSVQASGVHGCR